MSSSQSAGESFESTMLGRQHPGYRYLAEVDPGYLRAYEEHGHAVYGRDNALPSDVRELIVIALSAGMGHWDRVRFHVRRAFANGLSERDLLQALEYAATTCGMSRLLDGAQILAEESRHVTARIVTSSLLSEAEKVARNKETFRRLQHDVIAGGRLDLVPQIFTPTFRTVRAGLAGLMAGLGLQPEVASGDVYEQFRAGYAAMTAALGGQQRVIDELHGADDHIWARWRIRATHSGTFLGCPATGKSVEYAEVGFMRFDADGRIDEGWFLCDEFGLAAQLGLRFETAGGGPPP